MTHAEKEPMLASIDQVETLIRDVIEEAFPELVNQHIRINTIDSEFAMFRSRPVTVTLLNPAGKTRYLIDVSNHVFDRAVPLSAAKAILAHELAHTSYYVRFGRMGSILALGTLFLPRFRARFERATDIDAISRGYGPGIKHYRQVTYQHLDHHQLEDKHHSYYVDEEIDALMAGFERFPYLRGHWITNPPMSKEAIERDLTRVERGELKPERGAIVTRSK